MRIQKKSFELCTVIFVDPDGGDQWIAHCLDLDLVTQGNSPSHAIDMIREASLMIISDDIEHGDDPFARRSTDEAEWARFAMIMDASNLSARDVSPPELSGGTNDRGVIYGLIFGIEFVEKAEELPRIFDKKRRETAARSVDRISLAPA